MLRWEQMLRRSAWFCSETFIVAEEEGLILLNGPARDAPNWLR
jgi:hypothetical protein